MTLGPHLCAQARRLKSPGKMKRHCRHCETCRPALAAEMERRLRQKGIEPPPSITELTALAQWEKK